jgi:probable HAF family extracellular repeat protein
MRKSIAVFLLAAFSLEMPTLCNAASYTVTNLGTLGGNGSSSGAYGISANGQVTGMVTASNVGPTHAFLYDGTMHDLGSLGGTSFGLGVNDAGQVAGYFDTTTGSVAHAFLYDGTMHDLGTLAGFATHLQRHKYNQPHFISTLLGRSLIVHF